MNNLVIKRMSYFVMLLLVVGLYSESADAIPAFARKNSVACSGCHTAWPMLNRSEERRVGQARRYREWRGNSIKE